MSTDFPSCRRRTNRSSDNEKKERHISIFRLDGLNDENDEGHCFAPAQKAYYRRPCKIPESRSLHTFVHYEIPQVPRDQLNGHRRLHGRRCITHSAQTSLASVS